MTNDRIDAIVKKLIKKHNTRDPQKLATRMGIHILYRDDYVDLKGMYTVIERNRYIFLNNNLSEDELKTVCAHEIGHDVLHRTLAKSTPLKQLTLYDMTSRTESEANMFASSLLVNDQELLSLVEEGVDSVESAAYHLGVDVNLVLMRLHELNKQGHAVIQPYAPDRNFLK